MSDATPFTTPAQAAMDEQAALAERGEIFDGLGRRKIITPETAGTDSPVLRGYTRATSFISALEDSTALNKWRTRLILEGAADANLEMSVMSALQNRIDSDDEKAYRADLDDIAERAFSYAGGHDAADYGTALHRLAELWHEGELTSDTMSETEHQWPGILADFDSYRDKWSRLTEDFGARVVMQECLVVDDKRKVAGRADIVAAMKMPGDKRARRILVDIKTGKIDNGTKLSQQLAMYAGSRLYDPRTGKRTPTRIRQDIALVAHVPRGEASAQFHVVQLEPGRAANRLCERVRASRRKAPGVVAPLTVES